MSKKLLIALSSRALFDFEEENNIFDKHGEQSYIKEQNKKISTPAKEGTAFRLVKKLLSLNHGLQELDKLVEVVILSRNDAVSGLRVFNSIQHYGLDISRGVFTTGRETTPYLKAFNANLFLSAHENDVRDALTSGFPAAKIYPFKIKNQEIDSINEDEIRIAFDGDAVLFSDEAERVYKEKGLDAFTDHEIKKVNQPLPKGPFAPLLKFVHQIQKQPKSTGTKISTALVTARGAPAHERAIKTLQQWGITIDIAMFLSGLPKRPFLESFRPDFFFDDQSSHCMSAADSSPVGQVISGITNE